MTTTGMKVAIYARYSSDRQSERSIEDQIRLCRERAAREGWTVVEVFPDFALSGATRDRPGLNAMVARAADFDIVMSEALDRISRDQEDIAAIWKRVEFAGCRLVTVSEGLISELQVGFTGTMSAVFLKNLADKTRRGQVGRVAAGRIPGGLCYGYEADVQVLANGEIDRGRRRIVPEQAEVVRRIFTWRAEGRSTSFIVKRLNREGVPGPTGGPWRISTICGSRQRRNGILHNELYIGRIVFNRQRFVRDPATRKRVSRPNPEGEWKVQAVPELRILDQALWDTVAAIEGAPERTAGIRRQPSKRLLSGLITCGVCSGSFTVVGAERWGCSTSRATGTCTNTRTIGTAQLEHRILDALRHRLLQPDLVAAFIEEYRLASEASRKAAAASHAKIERNRAKVTGRIERLTDMMADGVGNYVEMKKRLLAALAEREEIDRQLEDVEVAPAIALHPNLADAYRRNIETLVEALNTPELEGGEARLALRNLIERITAEPRAESRGLDLLVHGRLAQILHIANGRPDVSQGGRSVTARVSTSRCSEGGDAPEGAAGDCMFELVAGAGYGPKQQKAPEGADCMKRLVAGTGFEPVTFRL